MENGGKRVKMSKLSSDKHKNNFINFKKKRDNEDEIERIVYSDETLMNILTKLRKKKRTEIKKRITNFNKHVRETYGYRNFIINSRTLVDLPRELETEFANYLRKAAVTREEFQRLMGYTASEFYESLNLREKISLIREHVNVELLETEHDTELNNEMDNPNEQIESINDENDDLLTNFFSCKNYKFFLINLIFFIKTSPLTKK